MGNAPHTETWRSLLALKGFSPVEDPDWLEEAYAEMPEVARTKASAFIAENSSAVAFRANGEWLYYRLAGGKASTEGGPVIRRSLWIPLGIGWEAIASLDRIEIPRYESSKDLARSKPAWKDPRSLEF
jgi:hypothetical protein